MTPKRTLGCFHDQRNDNIYILIFKLSNNPCLRRHTQRIEPPHAQHEKLSELHSLGQ